MSGISPNGILEVSLGRDFKHKRGRPVPSTEIDRTRSNKATCKEKNLTQKLNKLLKVQRDSSDRTRLGYNTSKDSHHKVFAASTSKGITFVKGSNVENVPKKPSKCMFVPTCHFCGIIGHTRKNCFRLRKEKEKGNINKFSSNDTNLEIKVDKLSNQINTLGNKLSELSELCFPKNMNNMNIKTKWIVKEKAVHLVAHTTLKAMDISTWYLDSACSRHMSEEKELFKKIESTNGGSITFGDGSTTTVEGKGSVDVSSLPTLHNVLFVNGRKANLLSINECKVYNSAEKWILKGTRTANKCYGVSPMNTMHCYKVELDEIELWHYCLGHINYKDMQKISTNEVVSGLCKILKNKKMVCGVIELNYFAFLMLLEPIYINSFITLSLVLYGKMNKSKL
ncbi:hypothetical protein I3842_11G068300 [Carya illinoinensis]|uniref:GAG-pre-integrase domain-containing protein n=1 Tax=Carya illinoinensis TaxID=32201 RepID=A0A922IY87_CARIL|nr:hypothetical protein I3842_11G068300 [Carya illinoinensis]